MEIIGNRRKKIEIKLNFALSESSQREIMKPLTDAVIVRKTNGNKGGLISEKFSRWLQSSKKCAPKNYPDYIIFKFRWIELKIVIFGRLKSK